MELSYLKDLMLEIEDDHLYNIEGSGGRSLGIAIAVVGGGSVVAIVGVVVVWCCKECGFSGAPQDFGYSASTTEPPPTCQCISCGSTGSVKLVTGGNSPGC